MNQRSLWTAKIKRLINRLGCLSLCTFALVFAKLDVTSAAALPARPAQYVKDDAGVLSAATRDRLDNQLAQFERDTSTQMVVYIARSLPANDELNDYANHIFRAWGIGQKKSDNGVLLAIFVDDHKLRIEVGRGLEGAIPDITAGHIMERDIEPPLKSGDYDRGVEAGVRSLMAAARGEYKGTGKTRLESRNSIMQVPPSIIALIVAASALLGLVVRFNTTPAGTPGRTLLVCSGLAVGGIGFPLAAAIGFGIASFLGILLLFLSLSLLGCGQNQGTQFSRRGRSDSFGIWNFGGGDSSWGGSSGGGSFSGFSGGGGDSGGGGASGSW